MCILNFPSAIKKWQSINLETLSLKTILNELDLLKKEVIIQWKVWNIDFAVVACKQVNRKITWSS